MRLTLRRAMLIVAAISVLFAGAKACHRSWLFVQHAKKHANLEQKLRQCVALDERLAEQFLLHPEVEANYFFSCTVTHEQMIMGIKRHHDLARAYMRAAWRPWENVVLPREPALGVTGGDQR